MRTRTPVGVGLGALWVLWTLGGCGGSSLSGVTSVGEAGSEAGGDGGPQLGSGDGGTFDGPGFDLDSGCATASARASRQPVYMLIVLDGSGSMSQENKWAAVVPALDAFFDDMRSRADTSFGVGLTVFSDQADPTCYLGSCNGPYTSIDVPIRYVDAAQAGALHARIDSTQPMADTPTVAVLEGQYPLLESFVPPSPLQRAGKKVLILMTDGVPNDPQNDPPASLQAACVTMAEDEFAKTPPAGPITTFAVGIGVYQPLDPSNYDPAFMGRLAVAGGAPNAGCNPNDTSDPTKFCHFQITPGNGKTAQQLEQEFVTAIDTIRGEISSCEFTLVQSDGGVGQVDPTKVNVVYDDGSGNESVIPEDPQNGWTYDDPANPTAVILHGAACDAMKKDAKGQVDIVLGCKTLAK